MRQDILFISDLHLSAARPETTRCFLSFAQGRARGARQLYILGDLFDAYIGDDDNSKPNREVKAALRSLTDSGTELFFQHGNRDFLVGERFCRETGASLLEDYALVQVGGETVLITHGDLLCTDDLPYQNARVRVRSAQWKRNALSKPLLVRQLYARWYRFKSGLDKRGKTLEIMDANSDTVIEVMRRFGVKTLVHGHTHRPAIHELTVDSAAATRRVLAEWHGDGSALCWNPQSGWSAEHFSA